jgi:ADP-ribose pyrophosphatase YjhB (NUDIX family)
VKPGWIPDDEWERIQKSIPIPHVDLLPVRYRPDEDRTVREVGLIRRLCPAPRHTWALRWSLLGGRMNYGESFHQTAQRQVRETLGRGARIARRLPWEPTTVVQYFPVAKPGFLPDPRKHAVSFVYALELTGPLRAQGEAREFRWFPVDHLPAHSAMGFENWKVVARCLENLRPTRSRA